MDALERRCRNGGIRHDQSRGSVDSEGEQPHLADDLAAIANFLRAELGHLADLVIGDVLRDFEFAVVLQVKTALLTEPVCSWEMTKRSPLSPVLVRCENDRR